MSVCVNIRTNKDIEPQALLKYLADKGEQIMVTSDEYPSLKFGPHLKAIRGIEVNKEDNGFEVRVCSFASTEDYQLFGKTINALMELTGDKAYLEDDDDSPVDNPLEMFNDEWIESERESSFMVTRAMIKHSGCPIVMYGIFMSFCIGPKLYNGFDIEMTGDYNVEDMDSLQDYLRSVQWHFANKKDTSTRMVIPSPSGDERDELTISMISIENGKVGEFDYISEASLLGIIDMDDEKNPPLLIPFKEIWKILPGGVFRAIDEWQYEKTGDLTIDMVHEMMVNGRHLQPEDLHYRPTFPGEGYDDKQNTFILMWNPAISSVTLEEHNDSVSNMLTESFNWSVWDYKEAKCGDRFYLVRVGEGKTGVVMSGVFDSNPYEAGDWSGKGRQTFYMDMIPNVILNPETAPMLTTKELTDAIPSFKWSGGHSGRILTSEQAQNLENLWAKYIEANKDNIDGVNMNAIDINF